MKVNWACVCVCVTLIETYKLKLINLWLCTPQIIEYPRESGIKSEIYDNKNRSKQQQITYVFVSLFQFQIESIASICTPKVPFKSWRGCPSSIYPPPCRNTQSNVWNSLFIAELNSNAEKQQAHTHTHIHHDTKHTPNTQ